MGPGVDRARTVADRSADGIGVIDAGGKSPSYAQVFGVLSIDLVESAIAGVLVILGRLVH